MSSALTSIHIVSGDDVSSLPQDVIVTAELRFGDRRVHIAATKAADRPHIVAVTISSSATIAPALEGLPPVTWTCVSEAVNGDASQPRFVWYAVADADSSEAPVTDIAVPLTSVEAAQLVTSGFVIGDPITSDNTSDGTYHLWTKLALTAEETQTGSVPVSPSVESAFGGPSVGGFRAGDLCDCMDTVQTWLDARVLSVDVDREAVWVHYDGWADSWNELITLRSRRLAKYRSQVVYRPINEKPFKLYIEEALLNNTMERTAKIIQMLEEKAQAELQAASDTKPALLAAASSTIIPFAPLTARLQSLLSADDYMFLTFTENLKMIHFCVNATMPANTHTDDPAAPTMPPLIIRAVHFLKMNMKFICFALQTEIPLSPCWTEALIRICGAQACHLYHRYGISPNDREREEGDDSAHPVFASREATRSRQIDSKQRLPSVILIQLINLFGRYGGFAAINKQIAPPPQQTPTQQVTPQTPPLQVATLSAPVSRTTTPVPTTELASLSLSSAPSGSSSSQPQTNPLSTIAALIRCLSCISPFLEPNFASSYIASLKLPELTRTHLARITDDDLKALDKNQFIALITHIQQLLISGHVATAAQSQEFAEAMTMTMILRMINAQVLATRLEGILQVELIIAQIRANAKNGYDPPANSAGAVSAASSLNVQLSAPQLLTWLEENKVVDSLVGRDSHEQIVKRTPVILKFLAINQKLQPRHIDMLWSACAGKHEGLVRIVYDLIADLASVMSDELLETVYNRVVEKPLSEYKDYDIQLIKLFTFNAVRARTDAAILAAANKSAKRDKRDEKWFGLELFWNILHNSTSVASPMITALSAQALVQLLAAPEFKSQLAVYLDKCLNTLTLSPTAGGTSVVVPALQLAQQMIEKQPEQASKNAMSRADLIQVLENDKKLLSLIVESIVAYEKFAIPTVNQAGAVKAQSDSDTAVLLVDKSDLMIGGYTHAGQLTTRFNFLSFLLTSSKLTLTQAQVDSLWSTFIVPNSPSADQSRLLQWLSSAVEGKDRKDHIIFSPKLTKYILTDLLCSPNKIDHSTITSAGLTCFEAYFIHINFNVTEALLTASRLNPVVLNYSKLLGVEALWLIAINAKLSTVATTASQFLITLHLRVDFLLQSVAKRAILRTFVDKCMQQIALTLQQAQTAEKDPKKKASILPAATTPTKKDERKGFSVDQSADALTRSVHVVYFESSLFSIHFSIAFIAAT